MILPFWVVPFDKDQSSNLENQTQTNVKITNIFSFIYNNKKENGRQITKTSPSDCIN